MTRSWGNARDVETIGEGVYQTVLRDCNDPNSQLKADASVVLEWLRLMLNKRNRKEIVLN